jgi:hypothetical protein
MSHQGRLPLGKLPKACNATVPCLSTLAAGTSAASCPKSGPKSMCAGRLAAWDPETWANPEATGTLPNISAARLEHVCGSIMVHVARPSWRDLLDFNRSTLWVSKYVMRSLGTQRSRRAAQQRRCVARLQSFRPCVLARECLRLRHSEADVQQRWLLSASTGAPWALRAGQKIARMAPHCTDPALAAHQRAASRLLAIAPQASPTTTRWSTCFRASHMWSTTCESTVTEA